MKSVLISIQPTWCELIASGIKTVEVRKTRPKQETPFKCYIYRTKGFVRHLLNDKWWNMPVGGTVIGEFVCDKIFDICIEMSSPDYLPGYPFPCTGLTDKEILQYLGNGKTGYGWHISDLVIYDKPRELSEFCRNGECAKCGWFEEGKCYKNDKQNNINKHRVTRPPQSWCYVEG